MTDPANGNGNGHGNDGDDIRQSSNASEDPPREKKRKLSTSHKEHVLDNEGPACQNCRKKKSACSRTQPCSVCVRYNAECVYHDNQSKPGIRTGAIDSLRQRVCMLEQMFLGQGLLWQQTWATMQSSGASGSGLSPPQNAQLKDDLDGALAKLRDQLSEAADGHQPSHKPLASDAPRPRTNHVDHDAAIEEVALPSPDVLNVLIDIYFRRVHPWIPMLHVRQFRERIALAHGRRRACTILYAITSLCVRFSDDARLGDDARKLEYARRCREIVILRSMESFAVENLQALLVCAFDIIGSGRGPSAWSIVGSMTRTVEQLQLSVEEDDRKESPSQSLIKRMNFLPQCRTWSETEERRRVFWNIFMMDRFCSVATGWNFSLTSDDVRRRLPCEGGLWELGRPLEVPTPYFGIADQEARVNPTVPSVRSNGQDQDLLGGFAFCIEATESLSLVTSFFLQHNLDFADSREVQLWLVQFKQLDLRLIQWKTFLPERWREASVLNADGNMDPNLTLAHMTHNTAVIVLHQVIAFPMPEWQKSHIRLPSASSADTCFSAATEVAIIAEAFLQRSPALTSPQFAFCLFMCGRMLLAYSSYRGSPLSPAFDSLVASLVEAARSWKGFAGPPDGDGHENLASKFATRLTEARERGQSTIDIRAPVCSEDQYIEDRLRTRHEASPAMLEQSADAMRPILPGEQGHVELQSPQPGGHLEESPDSVTMAFPPLPLAFQGPMSATNPSSPTAAAQMAPPQSIDIWDCEPDAALMADFSTPGFDDNSFLGPSFGPGQRVSVFSHANDLWGEQQLPT